MNVMEYSEDFVFKQLMNITSSEYLTIQSDYKRVTIFTTIVRRDNHLFYWFTNSFQSIFLTIFASCYSAIFVSEILRCSDRVLELSTEHKLLHASLCCFLHKRYIKSEGVRSGQWRGRQVIPSTSGDDSISKL